MKRIYSIMMVAVLCAISGYQAIAQTCDFYASSSVCVNQETTFTTSCSGTKSWYVDNVFVGSGNSLTYIFTIGGQHEVKLSYATTGGGGLPIQGTIKQSKTLQMQVGKVVQPIPDQQVIDPGETITKTVFVNAGPIIEGIQASVYSLCDIGNATLALTIPNTEIYSYSWSSSPVGFSGSGPSLTANNINTTTTFTVTAQNSAHCTTSTSVQIEVKKTFVVPQVDLSMPYHKRTVNVSHYPPSGHYWQTSAVGTDILNPVNGNLVVTEPQTYYIRNQNVAANCWTIASAPVQVTLNYTPPQASITEFKKSGYNEILLTNADAAHILQFANYYWVKDGSADPEIISQYNIGSDLVGKNIFADGTYYLKGKDIVTGTWGETLVLNITLRNDLWLNWIHTKSFDGTKVANTQELIVVSESKAYFDDAGKPLQSQTKSKANNTIFATQSLLDRYNRVAGSTLPAPIIPKEFAYNELFLQSINGLPYTYQNFDNPETGKVLNPDPVKNTEPGTLGWYYSANNTLEDLVPITSFPYSRTEFYEDGTGEVRRSASPGDTHRLGMGHEVLSGTFPVFNELDDYIGRRSTVLGVVVLDSSLQNKGVQSIGRDENGKYTISISDKSGKGVMTARSGTLTDWALKVDNVVKASANESSPDYKKMVYFYILNNEQVTIVTGTSTNIAYGSKVLLNQYNSSINTYVASEELRLVPGFSVPLGNTFSGKISEAGDGWIVENIVTGEVLPPYQTFADSSGNWPAGFYRLILLTGEATISYSNYYRDVAYQFYNDMGRLKTSVSPNGFKKWKEGATPATNYAVIDRTTYNYNFRGWLLSMTEPDAGTTNYVYRKDGKIRFSQNAEQKSNRRFSYTHYDNRGRPWESGEYVGDTVIFIAIDSSAFVSSNMKAQLEFPNTVLYASAEKKDWVRTYYDLPDATLCDSTGLPQTFQQEFVRGTVSYTENENIKTWYSYDELGRVTWMVQQPKALSGHGIKRAFVSRYEYDFLGNVLYTSSSMYFNGSEVNKFFHHYEYDADRRLSKVYTSLDGGSKKLRATYAYYLHGPLKRIELGDNVQGIDFVYNINGWLTQINHPDNAKDPGKDGTNGFREDAFGMVLDYYESALSNLFQASITPSIPNPDIYHRLPGLGETSDNLLAYQTNPVYKATELDWINMVKDSMKKNEGLLSIDQPSSH